MAAAAAPPQAPTTLASAPRRARLVMIPEGSLDLSEYRISTLADQTSPLRRLLHIFLDDYVRQQVPGTILNGDVFCIEDLGGGGYRNTGKLIAYNGRYHHLATEPDDYGCVPCHVFINGMQRADFFADAIELSHTVWFDWNGRTVRSIDRFPEFSVFRVDNGWTIVTDCRRVDHHKEFLMPYQYQEPFPMIIPTDIDRAKTLFFFDHD
jgi:hypothetical protein